ncbi:HalOD1 output domain-containing protein [Natrinema sp. DC36]|uniref:HalOD1 output domain-containing protein n=1 Tax=Natrinema sp. DC36 TaxID=2878680 RepID=UPI001CF03D38|nr:HalOD1 output domain-containing protein [Natrinema sp. DC36]
MTGTTVEHYSDSISLRVVEALATATGTAAHELEPLYNVVDPEALDQLFERDTNDGIRVTFEYGDSLVEVRSNGTVSVDGNVHDSG